MKSNKDDKILLAVAEDKYRQCRREYRITFTNFLDLHQRSLVEKQWKIISQGDRETQCAFYGGYEDAERTLALFLPDYAEVKDCPLSVIRVKPTEGSRKPNHRDYLGSILGLGLKREMIGDILVHDRGADIIVMDELRDFLVFNYRKAGGTFLQPEALPLEEIYIPEVKKVLVKDTVASLRLDNIIASAFLMSRGKASEAIRTGLVFVNSVQSEKPDMQIAENDKLVLRGKGKAYLREVGGKTRKDRIFITLEKTIT